MNYKDIRRFFAKVGPPNEQGCREWAASRSTSRGNYGQFMLKGRPRGTHRMAWEIAFGSVPDGVFVCHHCDNPPCVEPSHLFLGTSADNVIDMNAKGRGRARLNDETVRLVRRLYRPHSRTLGSNALGRRFGVDGSTMWDAIAGNTWSHVV